MGTIDKPQEDAPILHDCVIIGSTALKYWTGRHFFLTTARPRSRTCEQITTTPLKSIVNRAIWTWWLHPQPQRKRIPTPAFPATLRCLHPALLRSSLAVVRPLQQEHKPRGSCYDERTFTTAKRRFTFHFPHPASTLTFKQLTLQLSPDLATNRCR